MNYSKSPLNSRAMNGSPNFRYGMQQPNVNFHVWNPINFNNPIQFNLPKKVNAFLGDSFEDGSISKYGGCPWRNPSYHDDTLTGLNLEIKQFIAYIRPTKLEFEVREQIVKNMTAFILKVLPGCKVDVYGSFRTGLYLPTSDIDFVVSGNLQYEPLRRLHDFLISNGVCTPDKIRLLDKATVPLVKFIDNATGIKVDISFNTTNGAKAVEFIKNACHQYADLDVLILLIKQFLLQRKLHEVFHGGLSSYAVALMCISYVQDIKHDLTSTKTVGELLMGFFDYYAYKFNYNSDVISVKTADGPYLNRRMIPAASPNCVNIEDPITPGNNVGRHSFAFYTIKSQFAVASQLLLGCIHRRANPNQESVLAHVICITDGIIEFRTRLKYAHQFLCAPPVQLYYPVEYVVTSYMPRDQASSTKPARGTGN